MNVGCWTFLFLLLSSVLSPPSSEAQAPQLINYQGRLLNGTNLVNGSVGLSLRLFNAPAGGTPEYEDSNGVAVVDGLYATLIGDGTTAGSLVAALTNPAVYVEVAVNGVTLAPRERLAATAYALATRGWRVDPTGSLTGNPDGLNSIDPSSPQSVVGGGAGNRIFADVQGSALAGGVSNSIEDVCYYSFLGGGIGNRIIDTAWYTVLAGGESNSIFNAYYAFLGGGRDNHVAQGNYAMLGGGRGNRIDIGEAVVIGGGGENHVGPFASYSVIPGGQSNVVSAGATHALAAGYRARASHEGAFVWADRRPADFASTASNQFLIRAGGGVGINTNAPVQALHVNGDVQVGRPAVWAGSEDNRIINFGDANFVFIGEVGADDRMALRAGGFHFINGHIGVGVVPTTNRIEVLGGAVCTGPAWVNASDRNLKDAFQAVDAEALLARVAALPLATWHYKSEGADLRHIGPTAQDFHAAFGVGYNDTSIATVDADGVALAAIQALAQEDRRQRTEDGGRQEQIDALRNENTELMNRLEKLERELQDTRQERGR